MITFVDVPIGTGGPPRCTRCNGLPSAAAHAGADDVEALITAAVAAWTGAPGPNISLTGPEPFGHPELPAIVAAAARSGVERLRLETDAGALANPANAHGCIAAGVRHVLVTLLGGTPGVHDALVGEPGAHEAALAGLRAFTEAGGQAAATVFAAVRVPVCRHNVHDLPAAVIAAVDGGARVVTLRVDDPGLDLRLAAPWVAAACDTGVVNAVWVDVEGVPFCLLGEHHLHVADTVRPRQGVKVAACRGCALDHLCGGGPGGASADALGALGPAPDAAALAAAVAKSRGEVAR